jgi:hypothetical protein
MLTENQEPLKQLLREGCGLEVVVQRRARVAGVDIPSIAREVATKWTEQRWGRHPRAEAVLGHAGLEALP